MALNLANYQKKAAESVKAFWGNREAARQKQIEAGNVVLPLKLDSVKC
jgi:hypothetical protein